MTSGDLAINHTDTIDGRNPAPVDKYVIPLFTGFWTSQVVIARFLPSTVQTNAQFLNYPHLSTSQTTRYLFQMQLPHWHSHLPAQGWLKKNKSILPLATGKQWNGHWHLFEHKMYHPKWLSKWDTYHILQKNWVAYRSQVNKIGNEILPKTSTVERQQNSHGAKST